MKPAPVDSLLQTGLASLQAGDTDAALAQFGDARRLEPTHVVVLRILTALYRQTGQWPQAWSAAETGLAVLPGDADFTDARLAAMAEAGFADAALTLARMTPVPDSRLADLLLKTGDAAAALATAKRAVAQTPVQTETLLTAAEAAFRCGEMSDARRWLDQAVAAEPQNRSVRMARATILLSLGDWETGLKDYEYRLQPGGETIIRRDGLTQPRWQDQDLRNGRLLVVSEQGVGDQMRFLRDIIAIRPFCGTLIVECARRLAPLFQRSLPEDVTVVAARESEAGPVYSFDYGWLAGYPPADAWIEMGSLMLRLAERGLPPDRQARRTVG